MSKITESARGEECEIRLPGVCTFNPEQTVWAHANGLSSGKGGGLKSPDPLGTYACYSCHMVVDGHLPTPKGMTRADVMLAFHEAHQRSFIKLIEKGLVKF